MTRTAADSMTEPDVPPGHSCWCQSDRPWSAQGVSGMRWTPTNPGQPFPQFGPNGLPPEPDVIRETA